MGRSRGSLLVFGSRGHGKVGAEPHQVAVRSPVSAARGFWSNRGRRPKTPRDVVRRVRHVVLLRCSCEEGQCSVSFDVVWVFVCAGTPGFATRLFLSFSPSPLPFYLTPRCAVLPPQSNAALSLDLPYGVICILSDFPFLTKKEKHAVTSTHCAVILCLARGGTCSLRSKCRNASEANETHGYLLAFSSIIQLTPELIFRAVGTSVDRHVLEIARPPRTVYDSIPRSRLSVTCPLGVSSTVDSSRRKANLELGA